MLKIVQAIINRIEANNNMPPKRQLMVPLPSNRASNGGLGESVTERNRARTIQELVDTERGYVHALEELQSYQNAGRRNHAALCKNQAYHAVDRC